MSFNWSQCYPAESECQPYCALLTCDEIYRTLGDRDSAPMYNVIRSIDACSSCSRSVRCPGWDNVTRTETVEAASSLKYAVEHCNMGSCSTVYVDSCSGFARSVILASIIAFITTTIVGYFCIQFYHMYKARPAVTIDTYSSGTGIEIEEVDDDGTSNPVAAEINSTAQENAVV